MSRGIAANISDPATPLRKHTQIHGISATGLRVLPIYEREDFHFLKSIGIVLLLHSFLKATHSFSKFQTVERTFYAAQCLARYVRVNLRSCCCGLLSTLCVKRIQCQTKFKIPFSFASNEDSPIKNSSTALAASLPSLIAHTTSD